VQTGTVLGKLERGRTTLTEVESFPSGIVQLSYELKASD
jgi:hypothetical protein